MSRLGFRRALAEACRRLTTTIESFVPPDVRRTSDPELIRRARLTVWTCVIAATILTLSYFLLTRRTVPQSRILALPFAAAFAVTPLVLRWTGAVRMAASLTVAVTLGYLATGPLLAGPKGTGATFALALLPFTAILLTGTREGKWWACAAGLVLAALIPLESMGFPFPWAPAAQPSWRAVLPVEIFVFATLAALAYASEHLRERSTLELQEAQVAIRFTHRVTKQREAQLKAILDSAAEGIVTIDEDGRIETFNEAASRIFGWAPEEARGRDVAILLPEDEAPRHQAFVRRYLETGESRILGISREVTGRRRDGSTFPMSIAVSEVREGRQRIFTSIIRDLTTERRLEGQLLQAQKLEAIGQLAAGVAHEINTPAQYVGDNLGFLSESFEDLDGLIEAYRELVATAESEKVATELVEKIRAGESEADVEYLREEIPKALEQAKDGIGRVSRIVAAMKEFSHPGSDEKQLVDLNRAIESTTTVCRNEWKYVADLELALDPELPPVPCLPAEFNQVILNLVVNAAHALGERGREEKGHIRVRTWCENAHACIDVSDDGPGIPAEIQSRVFDPFFTTKPVGRGTGQGLAIARSVVVDKHGGTIELESAPGQGTTFHIRLPLEETASDPAELSA